MRTVILFALAVPMLVAQSSPDIAALQRAAEQGDAKAQLELAEVYELGKTVPKNEKLWLQWLRRSAEGGNPDAQNSLGIAYRFGKGVPRDFKEAVVWYRKAARGGSASAMFNLGTVYFNGEGEPINDEQSLIWFVLADKAGADEATAAVQRVTEQIGPKRTQDAYIKLGELYEKGIEVPINAAAAAKLYMQFPDYPPAQMRLASLYSEGRGVNVDQASAFHWCERAAKAAYPPGFFCVAEHLHHGIGISRDLKQAIKWYEKASDAGIPQSLEHIASIHLSGQLGKKDEQSALMLYLVLRDLFKVPEAKAKVQQVAAQMTLKDVKKAREKAEDWVLRYRQRQLQSNTLKFSR